MSLSPKIDSIFSIVAAPNKMEYELENGAVLEVPRKLVIMIKNPLVCYLIIEVNYARRLLIIKLMIIGIEFEHSGKASCIYDGSTKPERETKPS